MPKAVGQRVWIIRDKMESEAGGLVIPGSGREKPHTGIVHSVGRLVKDPDIRASKGRVAIFHRNIGQTIDYKDVTYLIVFEHEIIGVE